MRLLVERAKVSGLDGLFCHVGKVPQLLLPVGGVPADDLPRRVEPQHGPLLTIVLHDVSVGPTDPYPTLVTGQDTATAVLFKHAITSFSNEKGC
jgi:hypothetical protein